MRYVFEPRYVLELWTEWGKTNNIVTGRNILMKRMRIFATKTGVVIYPSIYIENKVMEEFMKEKFSAGDLLKIFKDLER